MYTLLGLHIPKQYRLFQHSNLVQLQDTNILLLYDRLDPLKPTFARYVITHCQQTLKNTFSCFEMFKVEKFILFALAKSLI